MATFIKAGWVLPERAATDEAVFRARRSLIKAAGLGAIGAGVAGPASAGWLDRLLGPEEPAPAAAAAAGDPTADLYPAPRNEAFAAPGRVMTAEQVATSYNNYYEFGDDKAIAARAQALPVRPWSVVIDGLVETPQTLGVDDLIRRMTLEERVYRLRCVEAWSMVVPWTGFPMAALVALARPSADAKFVTMETFSKPDVAPGQRAPWYPWPYVEGVSIEEANHPLAFLVTGVYGKPTPAQNGAPLRLALPWKYGFKSIKGIVRFSFTATMPRTFWMDLAANEYGFWANVNPEVAHPRWSQADERVIGEGGRIPTLLYNGYAEEVAGLYAGRENEKIYF